MSEPSVRPVNAANVSGTLGLPRLDETGVEVAGNPVSIGNTNVSVDARGLAVSDGSVERVLLGLLPSGDYGLQVTNGASVVIVDGTSNMFKITATGTMDFPAAGSGASAINSVDLATGFTYPPASVCFYNDAGVESDATPFIWFDFTTGHVQGVRSSLTRVVATDETRVSFKTQNFNLGAWGTDPGRYYLLTETAL